MNLLKYRYYSTVLVSIIRGLFFKIVFLSRGNGHRLRIGKNLFIRGKINLGENVIIGSNVKIFHNCFIGNNVHIDNNVELRSSKQSIITIGKSTSINRNSVLIGNVEIGANVAIAPGCVIVGANHNFNDIASHIKEQDVTMKGLKIMNNVWLGANVTVLDGVIIEEGSIIGAGSVVTKSISSNSIAVGNPCRTLKTRT